MRVVLLLVLLEDGIANAIFNDGIVSEDLLGSNSIIVQHEDIVTILKNPITNRISRFLPYDMFKMKSYQ